MSISDFQEKPSRVAQHKRESGEALQMADNRQDSVVQAKLMDALQRQTDDEDELLQGKFESVQRETDNRTGMPDPVKQRMESSFGRDFSAVRIHKESPVASDIGALAFTQGNDVSFAPGQFKPDTTAGLELIGHELTHMEQQENNRVQADTEINGMAVNTDPSLEHEADVKGAMAAR